MDGRSSSILEMGFWWGTGTYRKSGGGQGHTGYLVGDWAAPAYPVWIPALLKLELQSNPNASATGSLLERRLSFYVFNA